MKRNKIYLLSAVLSVILLASGCDNTNPVMPETYATKDYGQTSNLTTEAFSLQDIPEYSGEPYVEVNGNVPYFDEDDFTTQSFETYSALDELGRCGPAYANIGIDLMPTEERGQIGQVKPSGWHLAKYDCVDGKYLYNRCHLIGFQLTGENANKENLITGTRYLNVTGMLPFENMVADYLEETGNHVLYRVTPVFEGNNLIASGVLMEAMSVEDSGERIRFNVYVYNVQPGVSSDYVTGESWLEGESPNDDAEISSNENQDVYIVNKNSLKFHEESCSSVKEMKARNKKEIQGTREDLILMGYEACGLCNP